MRRHLKALLVSSLSISFFAIATAANADTLYSDGAPTGAAGGWSIYPSPGPPAPPSYQVQNSFTLSSASTVTAVTFGTDLPPNTTGLTVEWMIVDSEGSQTPACPSCSGTANLTPDGTFTVVFPFNAIGVNEKFAVPDISLSAGTYWLALQNVVTNNQSEPYAGWDTSGGPSGVWQSSVGDWSGEQCLDERSFTEIGCANAFTIIGSIDPAPEPASFILLGSVALLGVERRRRARSRL